MKTNTTSQVKIVRTTFLKGESFFIAGNKYHSEKEIEYVYSALCVNKCDGNYSVYQLKNGTYILCHSQPYPCFDSSDYLCENRCYNTFYFCKTRNDVRRKFNFIKKSGHINAEYLEILYPFVYIDDGEDTFEVYEYFKMPIVKEKAESEQMTLSLCGSGIIDLSILYSGTLIIDWGDGNTIETNNILKKYKSYGYFYSDKNAHTITIIGNITELRYNCLRENIQITVLDVSKLSKLQKLTF